MMNVHNAIDLIVSAAKSGAATDFESLKKLYKRAALSCHPDRNASENDCLATMKGLNAAWDYLSSNIDEVNSVLGSVTGKRHSTGPDPIDSNVLTHSTLPAFKSRETLLREAFTIIDDEKWGDWISVRHKTVYFSVYHLRVHTFNNCIKIYELVNALEARKTCTVYTIHWGLDCDSAGYSRFLNWVSSISTTDCITGVIAHLSVANYKEKRFSMEAELDKGLYVTKYEEKSGKVFSPFKLHKLAPLPSMPEGPLRHQHLVKLIANGQYRQLIRSQYLTDDYAHDAATNFGRKVYENPFNLLKELIEDKSGGFHLFKRSADSGQYAFGDHMNDCKSIIPIIDNRFPSIDLLDEQLKKQLMLQ